MVESIIEHRYRRRGPMGEVHTATSTGPARIAHDAPNLLVVDLRWDGPPVTSLWDPVDTHLEYLEVFAARMWWWTDRPLRLIQAFDTADRLLTQRVDFASPPERGARSIHQTDWYLDLFISGDGRRCVVADEDELGEALAFGLLSPDDAAAARAECESLLRLVQSGSLGTWLQSQCATPFEVHKLPAEARIWTYS